MPCHAMHPRNPVTQNPVALTLIHEAYPLGALAMAVGLTSAMALGPALATAMGLALCS